MAKERVISSIDIGSSKIATIISDVTEEGKIQIIGVSSVESRGIKKGAVVDIDEAVEGISESLEAAERMAGCAVAQAYIIVDGQHISSVNSSGVVAVSSPEQEISSEDMQRVIEAARAISIPSSREIVHVIPRNFSVDSQEGVADPIGMSGVRLQVETHIISGAATSMRNLVKCIEQVGVEVEDLVFGGIAASEAVLSETEKELGVILMDVGGGTTNLVFFSEGSPAFSSVLTIGGKNITNDIAIGLRISIEDAEKIKHFISDYRPLTQPDESAKKELEESLDISQLNIGTMKSVDTKFLKEGVIKPRLEELVEQVAKEIKKSGLEGLLPAGVVLCGGAAQTVGLPEVIKKILRLPVRIGEPVGVSGLIDEVSTPVYAASIGSIIYASKIKKYPKGRLPLVGKIKLGGVKQAGKKLLEWVKGIMPL